MSKLVVYNRPTANAIRWAHDNQIKANAKSGAKSLVGVGGSTDGYNEWFKCIGNYSEDGVLESVSVVDGNDADNIYCGKCLISKSVLDVPVATLLPPAEGAFYIHATASYDDVYTVTMTADIDKYVVGGIIIAFVDSGGVVRQYWQQLDLLNFNSVFWVYNG
jgi:hypothetical protein